jgi:hypothetical protein
MLTRSLPSRITISRRTAIGPASSSFNFLLDIVPIGHGQEDNLEYSHERHKQVTQLHKQGIKTMKLALAAGASKNLFTNFQANAPRRRVE